MKLIQQIRNWFNRAFKSNHVAEEPQLSDKQVMDVVASKKGVGTSVKAIAEKLGVRNYEAVKEIVDHLKHTQQIIKKPNGYYVLYSNPQAAPRKAKVAPKIKVSKISPNKGKRIKATMPPLPEFLATPPKSSEPTADSIIKALEDSAFGLTLTSIARKLDRKNTDGLNPLLKQLIDEKKVFKRKALYCLYSKHNFKDQAKTKAKTTSKEVKKHPTVKKEFPKKLTMAHLGKKWAKNTSINAYE